MARLKALTTGRGVPCVEANHWAEGGAGAEALAHAVVEAADAGTARFRPLYPDDMALEEKVRTVARRIYRARDIQIPATVSRRLQELDATEAGRFPVCMAKVQYSFSTDPALKGAPTGFDLPLREVRLSAGAEFVVVLAGAIMTMPGLPRAPAAERIDVDGGGVISGLF